MCTLQVLQYFIKDRALPSNKVQRCGKHAERIISTIDKIRFLLEAPRLERLLPATRNAPSWSQSSLLTTRSTMYAAAPGSMMTSL